MQYPTQGDLAREQVHRWGLLFFGDVQDETRERLARLPDESRKAFAVACAARLMILHELLPVAEQQSFTLSWRPVIEVTWSGLAGERDDALREVTEAL